jgi:hypothetical protein
LWEIQEINKHHKNEDNSRNTAVARSDVLVVDRTSALPAVVQTKSKGNQKVSAVESFNVQNLTVSLADKLAEIVYFNAITTSK